MSSAGDRGRALWPEGGPQVDVTCSRRAVMRAGLLGAAALSLDGLGPPSAEAAPSAKRRTTAPGVYGFNQNWLFGGVYKSGAEAPTHSERQFARITLPHTVSLLSWGDWNPQSWERVWIYRKHLRGAPLAGGRVFVDFQGVMTNATVFLGGVLIAEHQGGYLPWSVELTPYLKASDNVLAVVVDARQLAVPPDNRSAGAAGIDFLQPGGIYRDVALRVTPEVYIADVFAKPVNVLTATPGVQVQVTLDASYRPSRKTEVTAALLDGQVQLGEATGPFAVRNAGQTVVNLAITGLAGVTLWSPENPKLYQVRVTVTADGVPHTSQVTIGFRQASFELDGFHINGQRLQIFGLNRHQLFPYTGMAAPERLQRRDAEIFKHELGCNMVRCAHYPQSPHFLDACDELGLMVWEEPPGWQFVGDSQFQDLVVQNVRDMVVRDRNRPSVIVWGARLDEAGTHYSLDARARRTAQVKDGSRQTSGGMRAWSTAGWAEDVFAYNDYHAVNGQAALQPPLPGVPYLVSEAVGVRDGASLYRWVDSGATLAQQAGMHARVHALATTDSAYAGVLAWVGIDYASLNGNERIWHNLKWAGVLDTFRVAKPGAAFYRSQVDPAVAPVILPAFFWDFGPQSPPGGPGTGAMIATNCERLQLYLNDQLFAVGTPDVVDFPGLAHPPVFVDLSVDGSLLPELRIDGFVADQRVTTLKMSADTSRDRLALSVEDLTIFGDGSDATRFTFRALDAYGNQRPFPQGDVTLSLSGPARLVAENPFPFAAYGGVGGGLIQSLPRSSGAVTITASHPTLGQASANVAVQGAGAAGAGGFSGSAPPLANPVRPPSRAKIRASLATVVVPRGPDSKIGRVLRHGGYGFAFAAPFAGKLTVEWHLPPLGKHHRGARHGAKVARAVVSTRKPGRTTVPVKLTALGRRLFREGGRQRLSAKATFIPSGHHGATVSKIIELRP